MARKYLVAGDDPTKGFALMTAEEPPSLLSLAR